MKNKTIMIGQRWRYQGNILNIILEIIKPFDLDHIWTCKVVSIYNKDSTWWVKLNQVNKWNFKIGDWSYLEGQDKNE